jgi:hypothetical protein
MSCYEWEEGTIKLPSKDYSKIRKEFVARLNFLKEAEMKSALRLRDEILRLGNGKRGFLYYSNAVDLMDRYGVSYDVLDKMFSDHSYSSTKKPKTLTKKAMEFAKLNDTVFSFSEGGVYFNNKEKTVSWSVSENNHACEYARKSVYGMALFHTLGRVKWTSRTGGTIVGNNEYNRDDHGYGGGGNYVVDTYGKDRNAPQRYY